jgi:hypothetical protein
MEYNLPEEKVVVYEPFAGKTTEQMPKLLASGRVPLWNAHFMERRMSHLKALPDLANYLDVSDLVLYDRKDRSDDVTFLLTVDNQGKITETGRKALDLITPDASLTDDYALQLGEQYGAFVGQAGVVSVKRSDLGILGKDLTVDQIENHKIWRIMARHPDEVPTEFAYDKHLLKEYAGLVKGKTGQDKNMGACMDGNGEVEKLRAAVVDWLESGSGLRGSYILDVSNGRLVGYLAPEAQGAPSKPVARPSLEVALQVVNAQLGDAGLSIRKN